jgi:cation diffusion facilitator CzcD-associated flavoprotein CzcO
MHIRRLAIVGAGPYGTYALERLAAIRQATPPRVGLELHVFEKSGAYGSGRIHDPNQPSSNRLNRIASELAFAADSEELHGGAIRAKRETLLTWSQREPRQQESQDRVTTHSWPERGLHGQALREHFLQYIDELNATPDTQVFLYPSEVVDIDEATDNSYRVHFSADDQRDFVVVDEVLLVTGHPLHNVRPEDPDARGEVHAYPLEQNLSEDRVGTSARVGCRGMGLTAIDVVLYLSEGRGGTFLRKGSELVYQPSGREPSAIVLTSRSGMLPKAKAPRVHSRSHVASFFTSDNIDAMRLASCTAKGHPRTRQLDFEHDVLPLMLLEMATIYYGRLYGQSIADPLHRIATVAASAHVAAAPSKRSKMRPDAGHQVLAEITKYVRLLERELADSLSTGAPPEQGSPQEDRLNHYLRASSMEEADSQSEPNSRNGRTVASGEQSRFDWAEISNHEFATSSAGDLRISVINTLEEDLARASRGSDLDPQKAAVEGVWRDQRETIRHAVEFGGLTPSSHRVFRERYEPLYNRISNGPGADVLEKILALVKVGLVEVAGPGSRFVGEPAGAKVVAPGAVSVSPVDIVVDARVPDFDPRRNSGQLYSNLIERGLVRLWAHKDDAREEPPYVPGGLDVMPDFRTVSAAGIANDRISALGAPCEGAMFFKHGAFRPNRGHYVMRDIATWLSGFSARMAEDDNDAFVA